MLTPWLTVALLVLGGLLLFALGYAAGKLSSREQESPPTAEDEGTAPTSEDQASPAPAAPTPPAPPSPTTPGLHLGYDSEERLLLWVDGSLYRRYDAMITEHQRRLRTYLLQIRDWMQLTGAPAPARPAPRPQPRPASAPSPTPLTPRSAAPTPTPRSETPTPTDMVTALNDILQRKCREAQLDFAITLIRDWKTGGVAILVAGERYEAVDDIPNPQVQQLLREAVQEWEASEQA